MRKMKGSTMVETIVATLIVVSSFMAFMALSASIHKRTVGFKYYVEMQKCRDSVLTVLAGGGDAGIGIRRSWGEMEVSDDAGQVCVKVELNSGQRYTFYCLINESVR